MNFFQAQERARRNTVVLVVLFAIAVLLMTLGVYAALHLIFHGLSAEEPEFTGFVIGGFVVDEKLFLHSVGGVSAIILLASAGKIWGLSSGGSTVAESLDGQLVQQTTTDAAERKLLNIVEEMAIAAGTPVPSVYVIHDESINAFAAGTTINNAVIGVTKGALRAFSREEMQGVIAHEFSHIINGDMRMNIRMIGIIYGLFIVSFIGGQVVRMSFYMLAIGGGGRRSAGGDRDGGGAKLGLALVAVGMVLLVVGSVGTFFGSLIRAAVSRQREFLADAAAVQFTRNPHGIGGALEKIGKHAGILGKSNAPEFAHLFFGPGVKFGLTSMFASHPPLTKRLANIVPNWDGTTQIGNSAGKPLLDETTKPPPAATAKKANWQNILNPVGNASAALAQTSRLAPSAAPINAEQIIGSIGVINAASQQLSSRMNQALPARWQGMLDDPYMARVLIYLMLLDRKNPECLRQQLAYLEEHADEGVYALTEKHAPQMLAAEHRLCLLLVQRALPLLRQLSQWQYHLFIRNMAALIEADKQVELFEWCVQAIVTHALHDHFEEGKKIAGRVSMADINYALSLLARAGETPVANFEAAFPGGEYVADGFEPQKLFSAMQRLSKLKPKGKQKFIEAAVAIVESNGSINKDEEALLRAYLMLLDCPLPSVLNDAG